MYQRTMWSLIPGLGDAKPRNIAVLPVLYEHEVLAVLELASFQCFRDVRMDFLEQLVSIAIVHMSH